MRDIYSVAVSDNETERKRNPWGQIHQMITHRTNSPQRSEVTTEAYLLRYRSDRVISVFKPVSLRSVVFVFVGNRHICLTCTVYCKMLTRTSLWQQQRTEKRGIGQYTELDCSKSWECLKHVCCWRQSEFLWLKNRLFVYFCQNGFKMQSESITVLVKQQISLIYIRQTLITFCLHIFL